MRILKLSAENIKRLVAVEIEPDGHLGNLVQITGRNGAGKSSVLDAIWWALAGERGIQSDPIRGGEQRAVISLDLGDIVVTREFRRRPEIETGAAAAGVASGKGSERAVAAAYTTRLRVESADGARYPTPQTMLDGLLGSLTFDPLVFQRAAPRKQVEMLSGLCGIDIAAVEAAEREDYEERREFGRVARSHRAAAEAITVPADTPDERVSVTDLVQQIRDAEAHNREREAERVRRDAVTADADHEDRQAARVDQEAARLRQQAEELLREAAGRDERAKHIREGAQAERARLAALPPVEPDTDTSALHRRVEQADVHNRGIDARERRDELLREASEAARNAQLRTDRMDARRRETRQRIADADLGIDGLTVADGQVMLGDHPFDQASDAERLRASCAIAMRSDAKLRVLRVRDGSLLDEDSLRLLAEMAEAADYQVWVEMVDTSGKVGIVIEDGQVQR